jgi:transcriptional regulator with XRE-family HTH domain
MPAFPYGQQPHYIREWRKHRGLSQEQFAERVGITKGYLSKIETGSAATISPFLRPPLR